MKNKVQLAVVLIGTCLMSGCIVPEPYPHHHYGGPGYYGPEDSVYVEPDVIVVENGVRHDRFFYERHPDFYHRDQMRYPERFARRSHSPHRDIVESRDHGRGPHRDIAQSRDHFSGPRRDQAPSRNIVSGPHPANVIPHAANVPPGANGRGIHQVDPKQDPKHKKKKEDDQRQ